MVTTSTTFHLIDNNKMPICLPLPKIKLETGFIVLALLCLVLLQSPLHAAEAVATPVAEKIHIRADSMKMNVDTGNSIYIGNVKITQGELILTGDTVTIEQKKDLVERIIVVGTPASYFHITEANEPIHATSKKMVYTASKNRLILTDNAKLTQPEHTVKSQKIIYDTLLRTVVAGAKSPATKDQTTLPNSERVNITLTPKPAEK